MKKIISAVMAVVMLIGASACSTYSYETEDPDTAVVTEVYDNNTWITEVTEPVVQEIVLTAENITDYFAISAEGDAVYNDSKYNIFHTRKAEFTVDCYQTVSGKLNNVSITFDIGYIDYDHYKALSADGEFDINGVSGTDIYSHTLNIPVNGQISETYEWNSTSGPIYGDYQIKFLITDVTGTITLD